MASAAGLGIFAAILGIQSSTLGFISFGMQFIPQSPVIGTHSVMRVAVGQNGGNLTESDGEEPDIRVYDEYGSFLGKKIGDGELIDAGGFKDINIPQSTIQPTYALLTANKNAICISYLTHVWPDGAKYGWVGNWGHTCGKEWYYTTHITEDGHALSCTWIDGPQGEDAGEHGGVTALQVHFNEFKDRGVVMHYDEDYYCNNGKTLGFRTDPYPEDITPWDPPITFIPLNLTAEDRRRSLANTVLNITHPKSDSGAGSNSTWRVPQGGSNATNHNGRNTNRRRSQGTASNAQLVRTKKPVHSATYLCEHPKSRGPDLVSLAEGKFCDMDTRKVWPICGTEEASDCFDTETSALRQLETRDVSGHAAKKNYVKFQDWE